MANLDRSVIRASHHKLCRGIDECSLVWDVLLVLLEAEKGGAGYGGCCDGYEGTQ